jgi:rhamnosyltransferase
VDTDLLISSGCLIPVKVLTDIGLMDESLFIDYVDTEWGLRASQRGYRLLGASGNLMQHRIGDASQRVWFGRWRQVAIHKSFRYYYIFRNSLILFHRPCSFKWRLFHLKRLLLLFVFIVCSQKGIANIRYACAGVRDAFAGRTGPMPGTD